MYVTSFQQRKGLHVYIATQHNTEIFSKDVEILFIGACMSSLGVQKLCLDSGKEGEGRINGGFSSLGR